MDIVSNLILRLSVLGAAESSEEVDALDIRLARLGETAARTSEAMGSRMLRALTSLKTAAAGVGIYEAVKQYSTFNAQMTKLQTQAGATSVEMHRQSAAIMGMAVAVGTGPNSLAEGMYHLESAGIRGTRATTALRIAAQGAQIGGANLTDTVTGLTASMLAYGAHANQAQKYMAALNATVGAGDMTFQNLNDALGTGVLSTMKVLGLKLNDFGAAMAVFGDNNIRGAAAANRLRMSLMTLVHPSSVAKTAMGNIGLSEFQLAADLRKPNGLLAMLDALHTHLAGVGKVATETTLASIFGGGKNSAGIMTLYNQMGRLESKYRDISTGQKSFNKDWQDTQKTLAFSLHQLEALGEVLLIKVGKPLGAVVGTGARFLTWLARGKDAAGVLRDGLVGLGVVLTADYIKAKIFAEKGILNGVVASLAKANILVAQSTKVWEFNGEVMADGTLVMEEQTIAAKGLAISWDGLAVAGKSLMASTGLGLLIIGLTELAFHFKQVKRYAEDLFHFLLGQSGKLSKVFSWLNPMGLAYHASAGVSHLLGAFADGGTVQMTGQYMVGERGPEIVTLPAGAQVTANSQIGVSTTASGGYGGFGGDVPLAATIVIQNVMDGKVTGQVVHRQSLMAQSRQSGVRYGTGVTGGVGSNLGV